MCKLVGRWVIFLVEISFCPQEHGREDCDEGENEWGCVHSYHFTSV